MKMKERIVWIVVVSILLGVLSVVSHEGQRATDDVIWQAQALQRCELRRQADSETARTQATVESIHKSLAIISASNCLSDSDRKKLKDLAKAAHDAAAQPVAPK